MGGDEVVSSPNDVDIHSQNVVSDHERESLNCGRSFVTDHSKVVPERSTGCNIGRNVGIRLLLTFMLCSMLALAYVFMPSSSTRKHDVNDTTLLHIIAAKAKRQKGAQKKEEPLKFYQRVVKGEGKHYVGGKTDLGICGIHENWVPGGLQKVALNTLDSFGTKSCGMCIKVWGTSPIMKEGEIFYVNNLCPECNSGELGFELEETIASDIEISWKSVPCPVTKDGISYYLEGSNAYYVKVRPLKSTLPIAKMQFKVDGKWVQGELPSYGYYFEYRSDDGSIKYPLQVRLTSLLGEVLEDSIPSDESKVQAGSNAIQFAGPQSMVKPKLVGKEEACHTAVGDGDECHGAVVWASTKGINVYPDWFKGLTNKSSFEDFQLHLHEDPNAKVNCPRPCPPGAPAPPEPKPEPHIEKCHTAVKGEKCHDAIIWALNKGIADHPDWFKGLNSKSNLEDIQAYYYKDPASDGSCPMPCVGCHTSVEGEPCQSAVWWAKHKGVILHPDWFQGLSNVSSYEEFQLHLHNDPHAKVKCPLPCM